MLRKMLKYDFKSIARLWWVIAVSAVGLSFIGAIAFRIMLTVSDVNEPPVLIMLSTTLIFFVSVIGVIAAAVVTQILIFIRFYKHFFSDEGYLTFTLPVKRGQLLLSKTANAFIWETLTAILIGVCISLYLIISPPASGVELINFDIFIGVGTLFGELFKLFGLWTVLFTFEIILMIALFALYSISLIHFCITVGSVVAKKLKWLAAIGIYYLVNSILSVVGQFLGFMAIMLMGEGLGVYLEGASPALSAWVIAIILLIICTIMAAIAAIMYFVTQGTIERKLNLA